MGDADWIIWLLIGLTVLFSFKKETAVPWWTAIFAAAAMAGIMQLVSMIV